MTLTRICGKCGAQLNSSNTSQLKELQPNCNRCTNSEPTCDHGLIHVKTATCFHCGLILKKKD